MNDVNPNDMTGRVAVFRSTKYGWTSIFAWIGDEQSDQERDDYVRISDWTTVEFKPLTSDEVVIAAKQALTKEREKVVAEFTAKLRGIDERMANLRALTGPSS
jgi:hypothetical protein